MRQVIRKPAFAFAKAKAQFSLYFLNKKCQASMHLLWLCNPVCVGSRRKPRGHVISRRGSYRTRTSVLVQAAIKVNSKYIVVLSCRSLDRTIVGLIQIIEVKSMQRSGTEAIRTQIQPAKPKQEITKITNSQNTKRTYGQPSEQLLSKTWPLSNPNGTKRLHTFGENFA